MKDWFAVFAVALVIVVGSAAGLSGTVAFLLAFFITWYLLSARELGFAQARDALDVKLLPPLWHSKNWYWLERVFDDGSKLFRAATVALVVVALAQMFGADIVYGAAAIIAAYYVSEILRGRADPQPRLVRFQDGGSMTAARTGRAIPAPAAGSTTTGPSSHAAPSVPAPPAPAIAPSAAVEPAAVAKATVAAAAAAAAAPMAAPPVGRVAPPRVRAQVRPATRSPRPARRVGDRKRVGKRPPRKVARRPVRVQRTLPSRKDAPIALRPGKPVRRRPALRQRRRLRKPMTLVPRLGTPTAAAGTR